jgi:peroxiredoxin-like protein
MASVHEYQVQVDWNGGRDGEGTIELPQGESNLDLRVPPEFQGPGGGTNPEELLTSAIASCYSITLGIIAQNRKLPISAIRTVAVGEVEQNGAQFTYTKVTIRPQITLAADAGEDHEKMAHDMAHKADLYCIITNAVRDKVKIEVEPTISRG